MKKVLTIIFLYITGLASIIGCIYSIRTGLLEKQESKIEVVQIDKVEICRNINTLEELKDTTSSIWRTRFSLKNSGSRSIVGLGENNQILTDSLFIHITNSLRVYNFKKNADFEDVLLTKVDSGLYMNFKQWKPGKTIEIEAVIEGKSKDNPQIRINDLDVEQILIEYSEFDILGTIESKRTIDYLPNSIQLLLKYFIVAFILFLDLYCIIQFVTQIFDSKSYNSKSKRILALLIWIIFFVIFSLPLLWLY